MLLFSAEDEAAAARITAKNGLESYAYNLWNSLSDEKLADKFDAADKAKLEGAINEAIKWLDGSMPQEGSKEEYEEEQKELEAIAKYVPFLWFFEFVYLRPLLALTCKKLYGAVSGAPGGPDGFPDGHEEGHSMEEVD